MEKSVRGGGRGKVNEKKGYIPLLLNLMGDKVQGM